MCAFAHSLSELLPPNERSQAYSIVWRHQQVDRWFGQAMSPESVNRIRDYWQSGPVELNRPLWACGLCALEGGHEHRGGLAYPWDYGLEADQAMLKMLRGGELPFDLYPHLWERLHRRRYVLSRSIVGTSVLGYTVPLEEFHVTVLSPPPDAAEPRAMEDERSSRAMVPGRSAGAIQRLPSSRAMRQQPGDRSMPRRRRRPARSPRRAMPAIEHRRHCSRSRSSYSYSSESASESELSPRR